MCVQSNSVFDSIQFKIQYNKSRKWHPATPSHSVSISFEARNPLKIFEICLVKNWGITFNCVQCNSIVHSQSIHTEQTQQYSNLTTISLWYYRQKLIQNEREREREKCEVFIYHKNAHESEIFYVLICSDFKFCCCNFKEIFLVWLLKSRRISFANR